MAIAYKKEAIESYIQSVKLNLGNEKAIKILKGHGIKIDNLIKKVSMEYLNLLEGEYLNVYNKAN